MSTWTPGWMGFDFGGQSSRSLISQNTFLVITQEFIGYDNISHKSLIGLNGDGDDILSSKVNFMVTSFAYHCSRENELGSYADTKMTYMTCTILICTPTYLHESTLFTSSPWMTTRTGDMASFSSGSSLVYLIIELQVIVVAPCDKAPHESSVKIKEVETARFPL